MSERSGDGASAPLPREWLRDGHPPESDPIWDTKAARITAIASSELLTLSGRRSAVAPTGWASIAPWWKPVAVLAAASVTLLLLVGRSAAGRNAGRESVALGLVASNGDPATLWGALGVQADPVLAQIAIQNRQEVTGRTSPPADGPEAPR